MSTINTLLSKYQSTESLEALEYLAARELRERLGYWHHFRYFIKHVCPQYKFYRHCEVLINVLQRVADGEIKRLIVMMPPRHGKSETITRLFSAYYLSRYPHHSVGIACYGEKLALGFSKDARTYYLLDGQQLRSDSTGVEEWRTKLNGIFWAAGLEGTIIGRGFHLGIIDDPFTRDSAMSKSERDKVYENYLNAFYTRQEPNGAIILNSTRWHLDDLIGRVLENEKNAPERWHIVCFSADTVVNPEWFPETCTVEPDWREKDGIPLCPERFPIEYLEKIRNMDGLNYDAMYRQNPVPKGGTIWKESMFENEFTEIPQDLIKDEFYWDTAYTTKLQNSASAYVRIGIDSRGNLYIIDFDFKRLEFPQLVDWIGSFKDYPHYIEPKASGLSLIQTLRQNGVMAYEIKTANIPDVQRTEIAAEVGARGRIYIRSSIKERFLHDKEQGILQYPFGKYSDVNDALSHAIIKNKALLSNTQTQQEKYEEKYDVIRQLFEAKKNEMKYGIIAF